MNNLHRELAPVSDAAWASMEDEARRTFTLHLAGRRVTDVQLYDDLTVAAVDTGHLSDSAPPTEGIVARLRTSQPMIELVVPFMVSRQAVDDVERGARDSDWQPVKDAARAIALAEDRIVFDGYSAGGVTGIKPSSPLPPMSLPADVRHYPGVISGAISALRLAGVGGTYALLLGAEEYSAVSETSDHGYPVREHLARIVDGPIVWAPAIAGAVVLSTRGGDFSLHVGQDLSIGYDSHDAETVRLYFMEALTFLVYTPEASIPLGRGDVE